MIQALYAATVNDRAQLKLSEASRRQLDRDLRLLVGKKVELSVRESKPTRSSQQNKFWWGVVVPILAEHCGYTKDEMHEALKYKFLRTEAESGPTDLPKIRSTAALTTKEFNDLIENVTTWAGADLSVNIPAPSEYEAR